MAPTGQMSNIAHGKGGIPRDPHSLANHRFFAGSQEEMLRRAVQVTAELAPTSEGLHASLAIRVSGAGHRVPTGFIDRHLILVVEALDVDGRSVALCRGPKLPASSGKELAGRPGQIFAKQRTGADGRSPVPFWQPPSEFVDTRLHPERTERVEFVFAREARNVQVRLLYRRFWQEVAEAKDWPDETITVVERKFMLGGSH
jgi:hypothetical protein